MSRSPSWRLFALWWRQGLAPLQNSLCSSEQRFFSLISPPGVSGKIYDLNDLHTFGIRGTSLTLARLGARFGEWTSKDFSYFFSWLTYPVGMRFAEWTSKGFSHFTGWIHWIPSWSVLSNERVDISLVLLVESHLRLVQIHTRRVAHPRGHLGI